MIRWIIERLGTAPYGEIGANAGLVLDVRHLVDKAGNPAGLVANIIRQGVEAFRRGETVVVACDFGISRSNSIAAGILSGVENKSYDWALNEVMRATGELEIKLEMVETVRLALGEARRKADRKITLVTGASGFIGRDLVDRLRTAGTVLGPPRTTLDLERGAIALADYCAVEGVGQIVHLAFPRLYTNVGAAASSLVMLRAVLDTCKTHRIRLIYISSWAVFAGYTKTALMADETLPMRPKGVYADTKYMEEILVNLYAERHEIERSICRFTSVYGPRSQSPRLIRNFYEASQHGRAITTHRYRNGLPALDLLHVDDAVEALARVVEHGRSEIYHFGTGQLTTTTRLAAIIARIAGKSTALDEISIDDDIGNVAFLAEKARKELLWQPLIAVEEGLAQLLKSEPGFEV